MPVHVHYQIIGENISRLRKERNLTQEQLAECAGICQQFLSRIETGKGIPSVETVMALCNAMEIEANDILSSNTATHNPDAPCRLRSSDSVFTESLTDTLIHMNNVLPIIIRPEDLPAFDLEIPVAPDSL